jgi:cell wall-associated NlpC family hydrolase
VTPAPAPEPTVSTPAAEPVAVRTATTTRRTTTTRTAPRTVVPVRLAPVAAAPVAVAAPAPVAEVPVPAPAAPVAAPPPEIVATTPEPAPAPVEATRTAPVWPWLLLGALLVAGALFLAARRRRRTDVYETAAEDRFVEPAAVPVAPVAAAAAPLGEAEIELGMRPIRAGVAGDDARVEFQLTVGNRGAAPAEGVRVSTWMLAAGSSEMEQALIEPRAGAADTSAVTIPAGESRTLEAAVALPTAEVEGDSVLPVVVADAAWRDSDGRERHTRVSYAVGVEVEGDLAHFDVDNPSGLHDDVVAQPLDALERA